MNIVKTSLPGLVLVEPDVHADARGHLTETYHRRRYAAAGLDLEFVQDNLSFSRRGTLRGLHYQHPRPQGKLVYVLQGDAFDVAVDIRRNSPTFGRWAGVVLSGENHRQLYVPPGFAHGFCVISDTALVAYKCTDFYDPQGQRRIRWNDPELAIDWPIAEPLLSEQDRHAPLLMGNRLNPSARVPSLCGTLSE